MMAAPTIVMRTNIAGAGYVTTAEQPTPRGLLDALESALPSWQPSRIQRTRVANGSLGGGYRFLALGIFWPDLADQFERHGLFCWIAILYPPDMPFSGIEQHMNQTLEMARGVDSWLQVPLQILARYGTGMAEIMAELGTRIGMAPQPPEGPRSSSAPSANRPGDETAEGDRRESESAVGADETGLTPRSTHKDQARLPVSVLWQVVRLCGILFVTVFLAIMISRVRRIMPEYIRATRPPAGNIRRPPTRVIPSSYNRSGVKESVSPRASTEASMFVSVVPANLNVRAEPNTSADIVSTIHEGDQLEVLETHGAWRRVRLITGEKGWVADSYVTNSP